MITKTIVALHTVMLLIVGYALYEMDERISTQSSSTTNIVSKVSSWEQGEVLVVEMHSRDFETFCELGLIPEFPRDEKVMDSIRQGGEDLKDFAPMVIPRKGLKGEFSNQWATIRMNSSGDREWQLVPSSIFSPPEKFTVLIVSAK